MKTKSLMAQSQQIIIEDLNREEGKAEWGHQDLNENKSLMAQSQQIIIEDLNEKREKPSGGAFYTPTIRSFWEKEA